MYLTYEEYVAFGGQLDSTTFTLLEMEAENVINWYTFNRLKKETTFSDDVKKCMYILINLLHKKEQSTAVWQYPITGDTQATIASQSNDGVSISYNVMNAENLTESIKSDIENVIKMTLQGTVNSLGHKLLYRGIYEDE